MATNKNSEALTSFVDRAVRAEKLRHPLLCTLRVMHAISLKRIGLPPGGGWRTPDPQEVDNKFLSDVLHRAYWEGLPELAKLYENGLQAIEVPEEETLTLPSGETEWMPRERPILMLPLRTRPEYIPEYEAEIVQPEPLPVIDEEELAAQAVDTANQALSVFQGDCELWENPEALLEEIENTLVAVSPHHPNKLSLFERVTFVRECFYRLEDFERDFDEVLNTPRQPDESWMVPWLAKASIDLQQQGIMPTPSSLKRASIAPYLVEKWKSHTTATDETRAHHRENSTSNSPIDAKFAEIQTGTKPFTGPASSPDACF